MMWRSWLAMGKGIATLYLPPWLPSLHPFARLGQWLAGCHWVLLFVAAYCNNPSHFRLLDRRHPMTLMNHIESSSSGLPGPWYWYEISWWLFLGRGQHGGASRWNGHRGRFACHLQRTYVCCALLIHLVCSKKSYRCFSFIWSYIFFSVYLEVESHICRWPNSSRSSGETPPF